MRAFIDSTQDGPYQPPFKIGEDVYILTCGMKAPATIAEMPYKAIFSGKWMCKVFLTKASSWAMYEIANIVHREREMDKLTTWDVMYNVLGIDIRDVPPDNMQKL